METIKFCRVLLVEFSKFFGTEIGKDKPHGVTKYDEYKNILWTKSYSKNKKNTNDIKIAVGFIIDEVEKEKIQRRLFLGKEIVGRIKYELDEINKDLKKSKKRACKCAKK